MENERVREVVEALVETTRALIKDKTVTYEEFHTAIEFLVRLGETKEIPLLLAVFLEATVDEVSHAQTKGSTTTIQGPFHVPGAPMLEAPYKLPRRVDESGDPLIVSGTVRATNGSPLGGTELDMWQATGELPGKYSNVHPGLPDYNLRGRFTTDPAGTFSIETVVPAQYEIRKNGPTGELFGLLGRSAWRPAHLHFIVSHPGYRTLTTQLFFEGDQYLATDAGNAVKTDLIIPLHKTETEDAPGFQATYNFILEPSDAL